MFLIAAALFASAVDEARQHRIAGRFEQAITLYRQAIAENPDDIVAWEGVVRSLLANEQSPEALKMADEALKHSPDTPEIQVVKAMAAFRRGDLPTAEGAFKRALQLRPNYPSAIQGISALYGCVSRFKTAQQLSRTAAHLLPDEPAYWMALANATGSGPEHVGQLEKALTMLDPEAKQARRLRVHIAADKALADRKTDQLLSPYQPYQIKLEARQPPDTRFTIKAKFNGKHTIRMLVDTGASGISVTRSFAKKAGLEMLGEETTELGGIGDRKKVPLRSALAEHFSVGELEFGNAVIDVVDSRDIGGSEGLIGTDVFERFLVELDFPHHTLSLEPFPGLTNAPDPDQPFDAPSALAPDFNRFFRFGHLLLIPTSVNDEPYRMFLIDSGAGMNMVDPDVARKSTNVSADSYSMIRGVQGAVKNVYRAERMRLRFANIQQDNLGTYSFDLDKTSDGSGIEIAGIIGMPALGQLSVTIDYRNGAVRFQYRKK